MGRLRRRAGHEAQLIRIRVDDHRRNPHIAAGPDDPDGDLARLAIKIFLNISLPKIGTFHHAGRFLSSSSR